MKKIALSLILALALLLRLTNLSNHPAGFTPDEASFGYDAYSILKTGKDQWGRVFPLVLKSFGDDKLPVYAYLTIPSIAAFGLNEFSVRLPNAVLGGFSVIALYLLIKEIFQKEKIALLSGFLLAISPWHIMLSRGAFETNLTNFFLPFAVFFFLKSKKKRYLILSYLFFLINTFTYHTARILTPLLFFSLIIAFKNKLANKSIHIAFGLFLLIVSVLGILVGGSRISSSSILDINYSSDRYFAQLTGEPSIISKLLYNKPIYIAKQFTATYLSYFSPQFLFTNGPAEGTYGMLPGIGVAYICELILLAGFLLKLSKEKSKSVIFFIFWLLISPIPAAMTKGPGYAANRASFAIIPLVLILSLGGIYIHEKLKEIKLQRHFLIGYSLLLAINFFYVSERYLTMQTFSQASPMFYGMSRLIKKLPDKDTAGKIIISKSLSEPQIFLAFYKKIDPKIYQNYSKNWQLVNGWVDQQEEYKLSIYTIKNINYDKERKINDSILVGKPSDFPNEVKPDVVINYPDLSPAYYIISN